MNDKELEVKALAYWTRDQSKILKWIDLLAKLKLKFYITAYNEGDYSNMFVYSVRIEPIPTEAQKTLLDKHGFEHAYYIYKEK